MTKVSKWPAKRTGARRGHWRWAPWALVVLGAAALVLLVLWIGPYAFTRSPGGGLTAAERLAAESAVRATLVQAIAGVAVAAGAFVTYRTFRQNQQDQATRHDREERTYALNRSQQVTDTYIKTVEQLGHAQAAVRLGALYSLFSLAQADPARRQTAVDVLCAYLRMPYTQPTNLTAADEAPEEARTTLAPRALDAAQELQVRLTAQRLLAGCLRKPEDVLGLDFQATAPSPEGTFWPGIRVDLTGATLVDLDLKGTSVAAASFRNAHFTGHAVFDRAAFASDASFHGATFSAEASFISTSFRSGAWFNQVSFSQKVDFSYAILAGFGSFDGADFLSAAIFDRSDFGHDGSFLKAMFADLAWFDRATFSGDATFARATFSGDAHFQGAEFGRLADFEETTFEATAAFDRTTFFDLSLYRTVFGATVSFSEALTRTPDHPDEDHDDDGHAVLIPGWVVHPRAQDPNWGMIVPATYDHPQPDPTPTNEPGLEHDAC